MGNDAREDAKATLVKPPAVDPSKSAIENVLELTELSAIGPVRLPILVTYINMYL